MNKKTDKKIKKAKLTRDSFTMPANEYAAIDPIKAKALEAGKSVKKTEILRAGLALLNQCAVPELLAALERVPSLKSGRPAAQPVPPKAAAPQSPTPSATKAVRKPTSQPTSQAARKSSTKPKAVSAAKPSSTTKAAATRSKPAAQAGAVAPIAPVKPRVRKTPSPQKTSAKATPSSTARARPARKAAVTAPMRQGQAPGTAQPSAPVKAKPKT